nr:MAG TPA: hypothetical protein [Caudoviricetes sp.]
MLSPFAVLNPPRVLEIFGQKHLSPAAFALGLFTLVPSSKAKEARQEST